MKLKKKNFFATTNVIANTHLILFVIKFKIIYKIIKLKKKLRNNKKAESFLRRHF